MLNILQTLAQVSSFWYILSNCGALLLLIAGQIIYKGAHILNIGLLFKLLVTYVGYTTH